MTLSVLPLVFISLWATPPAERAWEDLWSSLPEGPVRAQTRWELELELEGETFSVDPLTATIDRTEPGTGTFEIRDLTVFIDPQAVVAIRDDVGDAYIRRPLTTGPLPAIRNLLGADLPFPMLGLLLGPPNTMTVDEAFPLVQGGRLQPEEVVVDPAQRITSIRFQQRDATLTLAIDPESGFPTDGVLQQNAGSSFPAGARLTQRWTWSFGPSASPERFARGSRFRVDRVQSLQPPGRAAMHVGSPAPPLNLMQLEGDRIDVTSLSGRVVVIDFWASWCGPCRRALPQLQRLASEMKDEPVTVLAVNTLERDLPDRDEKIRTVIRETGLNVSVLLDEDNAAAAAWEVSGIPATFVVGKDGRIWSSHVGAGPDYFEQLREEVIAALASS